MRFSKQVDAIRARCGADTPKTAVGVPRRISLARSSQSAPKLCALKKFDLGISDAHADTRELLRADLADDAAHAVVRTRAARSANAEFALGEVEIVVNDDHVFGRQLVLCQKLLDRPAARVHIGDGTGENDLFPAEVRLGDGRLAFLFFEFYAEFIRGLPHGEKTHVVEGRFVLFFGIAEPYDKIHVFYLCGTIFYRTHERRVFCKKRHKKIHKILGELTPANFRELRGNPCGFPLFAPCLRAHIFFKGAHIFQGRANYTVPQILPFRKPRDWQIE